MDEKVKICFMGTPDLAVSALKGLKNSKKFDVALILTQPDRKSGRGKKVSYSPVKQYGIDHSIDILQPYSFKADYKEYLKEAFSNKQIDLFLVLAYGQILPKSFLNDFPKKVLNIHGSLLPKFRGASPIHEAILRGEKESGITLMQIVRKMDAGPMICKRKITLDKFETSLSLSSKMFELIENETHSILEEYLLTRRVEEQNEEEVSYCNKIDKSSGKIDWNVSWEMLNRLLRAYGAWPSLFCFHNKKRIKILSLSLIEKELETQQPGSFITEKDKLFVKCKDHWLEILELQLEGKRAMKTSECLRGAKFPEQGRFDEF